MKECVPQCLQGRCVGGIPISEQQQRAGRFQKDGHYENEPNELPCTAEGLLVEYILHDALISHRESASGKENKKDREGHDAESAHLNEKQDDGFSEAAEVGGCVLNGKTGYTGGGGGREERIDKAGGLSGVCGCRQHQQGGAQRNGHDKTSQHELGGAETKHRFQNKHTRKTMRHIVRKSKE